MNEKASRSLFVLELILFAMPSLALLAVMVISMAALFVISLGGLLAGSLGGFLRLLLLFAATALGTGAIWKFLKVAGGFLGAGRASLPDLASDFYRGAYWAVPSLPVSTWVAFTMEQDVPIAIVMSGLPLLIPAFHLWLEIRRAATSAA